MFGSAVRELSDVGESGGRLIFAQNDSSVWPAIINNKILHYPLSDCSFTSFQQQIMNGFFIVTGTSTTIYFGIIVGI